MKTQLNAFLSCVLLLVGVAGCNSTPYSRVNLDTINKVLLVSTAEVRAANLLLQDVVNRQLVTKQQALQALAHLRTASLRLHEAKSHVKLVGDPLKTQDLLERFAMSLDLALQILGAPAYEAEQGEKSLSEVIPPGTDLPTRKTGRSVDTDYTPPALTNTELKEAA